MSQQKDIRTWPYFALAAAYLVIAVVVHVVRGNAPAANLEELGLVLTLLAWAICRQIKSSASQNADRLTEITNLVAERMEQFSVMLNLISEQQLISERAKAVAFRDKDYDALHRAIREEMARGQYDAALLLVNDVENSFGYKQESEQLRAEIAQLRDAAIRRIATEAIAQIDRDCTAERWDQAIELAERLAATYPGHEMTVPLRQQVLQRKDAVKQTLLQRWRDAVALKDIDGSINILRQLDIYVTAEEVSQLRDGALEIFKARIERLREHFKKDVHEKNWADAIQVGQDILADFPTSKLAQEVRDMMDMLQARKAEEAVTANA